MKIAGRRLLIGEPEQVDVVIFDEGNSHFVRQAINTKYSIGIFNQRPADLHVSWKIIARFLSLIFRLQVREARQHRRGFIVGLLRQLRFLYVQACLMAMRPKAVVTFIDNAPTFGWLARHCRAFPLIAIQNGSRLSYAASQDSGIYHQHLFCFGTHETTLLPMLGWQVEHFYPVGSLIASLHFEQHAREQGVERDVLVVSTWRGNIGFPQDVQDTMRSMRVMDELLATYITSRKIRAAVILRAERDSEHWAMPEIGMSEEAYFRSIYADGIEIIETDFSKRNIFPLVQGSEVIVSCLSSALMEALGVGKKICYFNFTGTDLYHRDIDAALVSTDCDREAFFQKIDALLAIPAVEFANKNRHLQARYMNTDAAVPTYRRIADGIDHIIESASGNDEK